MKPEAAARETIIGHKGPLAPGVKTYDFKRPDKFSRDQIRTVSIMHETFARLCTNSISAQLRSLAHMHVTVVDQMTYEEFIRSIPAPTTLAVIQMDPLRGSAVLQIDPAVTFAVIDRLLGGSGTDIGLKRDLTDIEQSVMEGIIVRLISDLREAWSAVIDLRPHLGQIETNPQFVQIVPPAEMIVLVTVEVRIGELGGRMNLAIPYLTIEPIIPRLSAQYWYSSVRLGERSVPGLPETAASLKAEAAVIFETENIPLRRIYGLKKNSLVKLNDYQTAFLLGGGKPVLRLKAHVVKGRYRFTVDETAPGGAAEETLFRGAAPEDQAREKESLEKTIHAAMDKVAGNLRADLDRVAARIEQLGKRQEQFADQFFHTAPAGTGEPGGAGREAKLSGRPFAFAGRTDPAHLLNFIRQEHPQTIALILSYLEPQTASLILGGLPREIQPDVARRIAVMDRTSPEVLREVERVLEKKLSTLSLEEYAAAGGLESIVEILNLVDRSTEKTIIESLETGDPGLAEGIKKRMFVFEDVVLLEKKVMRLLVKRIEKADLLLALKAVNEKTKEHFLKNMEPEALKDFTREFQEMGPARLARVEEAQQRIIKELRKMEEAGEIEIARQDEPVV